MIALGLEMENFILQEKLSKISHRIYTAIYTYVCNMFYKNMYVLKSDAKEENFTWKIFLKLWKIMHFSLSCTFVLILLRNVVKQFLTVWDVGSEYSKKDIKYASSASRDTWNGQMTLKAVCILSIKIVYLTNTHYFKWWLES